MAYFSSKLCTSLPCKIQGGKLSTFIGRYEHQVPFAWSKEYFPTQNHTYFDSDIAYYLENDNTKLVIFKDGACKEFTKDNYLIRSYACNLVSIEDSLKLEKVILVSNGTIHESPIPCRVYKADEDTRLVVPPDEFEYHYIMTRKPTEDYFSDIESGEELYFVYDEDENMLYRVDSLSNEYFYSVKCFIRTLSNEASLFGGAYGL